MLCGVVKQCLDQVRMYGSKSIAFPTLGCGNLKYPPKEVARCFKEICTDHGQGLQVNITLFFFLPQQGFLSRIFKSVVYSFYLRIASPIKDNFTDRSKSDSVN